MPRTSSPGSRKVRLNHCRPMGAAPQGSGACGETKAACGKARRPFAPEADQIVAVGAIAVQEHDQLARRAASRRRQSWSVER